MTAKRDFFISFTSADSEIASTINQELCTAGFETWFYPEDKPLGGSIANWMEMAIDASHQMIALCSNAYFSEEAIYSKAERQAQFWDSPLGDPPKLLIVLLEDCKIPRLLAPLERINLTGLAAPAAAAALIDKLKGEQARLGREAAREADRTPPVFNVPGVPNRYFSGRTSELLWLHRQICRGETTAICAVSGLGGWAKQLSLASMRSAMGRREGMPAFGGYPLSHETRSFWRMTN